VDLAVALNKEPRVTSHDIVQRMRRALRTRAIGHAGTLDPFATGVLVVLTGRATKVARFLTGADKSYEADVLLGRVTDTDDCTGHVLDTRPVDVTREEVEAALGRFRGVITQIPPRISAVWVAGERMYRRARRGEDVVPPPRTVTVHRLFLTGMDGPRVSLLLECSSGTYVRSIARDLGEALGTGASLERLVRLHVGPFGLSDALPSVELTLPGARERVERYGKTIEEALLFLPGAMLSADEAERLTHGHPPRASAIEITKGVGPQAREPRAGEPLRLVSPAGEVIAMAETPEAWGADATGEADSPLAILRVIRGADLPNEAA